MTRMTVPVFNELLRLVSPSISKRNICDSISSEMRLALTLQYLSQKGTMESLAWQYHIGITTAHTIIKEACTAIWDVLYPIYLRSPSTANEWKSIAGFFKCWNFSNCIGALDGKHINIQAPPHSGSKYFNYKGRFSIVLLGLCDANYNITVIDIGAFGSSSDGGVFKNSAFGYNFDNMTMNLPPAEPIPQTNINFPYVMVADEAFPLKSYILRPFPGRNLSLSQRVFNYRLSRARRCIENTIGILVARRRILKQTLHSNVERIVKACVVLHNYCKSDKISSIVYCPQGYADSNDENNGLWRIDLDDTLLPSVGRLSANNAARATLQLRDELGTYFLSAEGSVPWQLEKINAGTHP